MLSKNRKLEQQIKKNETEKSSNSKHIKDLENSPLKENHHAKILERKLRKSLTIDKGTQITPIKSCLSTTRQQTKSYVTYEDVFSDSSDSENGSTQLIGTVSTIPAKHVQAMIGKQKYDNEELQVF